MFFNILKRKNIKENNIEIKSNVSYGFNNALDFARNIIKDENREEKVELLNYILNTVKKDLQYSLLTELIYKKPHEPINLSRTIIFPSDVYDENGERVSIISYEDIEISILDDTIILVPWNIKSKSNGIKYLSKNDFKFFPCNHMGIYYNGLDLTYVYNGIHSISSSIVLNKKGKIKIKEVHNINKLYKHMYTDGLNWYSTHTKNKICEVLDFRIAIIYEVSKLKYSIEQEE